MLLLLQTTLLRECRWDVGREFEVNDRGMESGHCHTCELSVEVDWDESGLASERLVYLEEVCLYAFEFV